MWDVSCELWVVSRKSRVASRRVHVDHSGNRWCVHDEPLDTCVRHNNRYWTGRRGREESRFHPEFILLLFLSFSLLLEWLAWLTFQVKKMRIGEEPGYFSIRSRWLFVLITSASTLNSSLLATQSELNFRSLPFEGILVMLNLAPGPIKGYKWMTEMNFLPFRFCFLSCILAPFSADTRKFKVVE